MSSTAPVIPGAPSSGLRRISPEDVPPELRDDPLVKLVMNLSPEQEASCAALLEAGELYGDDTERALADLEAGRHPLQRARAT